MSDKSNLPTFEEITTASINGLFAPVADEAESPFLDVLFVPPAPETFGRIAPAAAPVKLPKGKCRVVDDPARRWFARLHNDDYPLYVEVSDACDSVPRSEEIKVLRSLYTKHLIEQEQAALNEQCAMVKSWRG